MTGQLTIEKATTMLDILHKTKGKLDLLTHEIRTNPQLKGVFSEKQISQINSAFQSKIKRSNDQRKSNGLTTESTNRTKTNSKQNLLNIQKGRITKRKPIR